MSITRVPDRTSTGTDGAGSSGPRVVDFCSIEPERDVRPGSPYHGEDSFEGKTSRDAAQIGIDRIDGTIDEIVSD